MLKPATEAGAREYAGALPGGEALCHTTSTAWVLRGPPQYFAREAARHARPSNGLHTRDCLGAPQKIQV